MKKLKEMTVNQVSARMLYLSLGVLGFLLLIVAVLSISVAGGGFDYESFALFCISALILVVLANCVNVFILVKKTLKPENKKKVFFKIFLSFLILILILLITIDALKPRTRICRYGSKSARIGCYISQVRTIALLIRGEERSDYRGLCTEEGGLNINHPTYGADLLDFQKEMTACFEEIDINCYSSESEFCIEASLYNGEYVCIDSDGRMGEFNGSSCTSSESICSYH